MKGMCMYRKLYGKEVAGIHLNRRVQEEDLPFAMTEKTIAAAVIEVQITDKKIKIIRVTNVINAGLNINPKESVSR